MASNPIDIEIMGRAFSVTCTDEERDSLLQAVGYLDGKMREIRDAWEGMPSLVPASNRSASMMN